MITAKSVSIIVDGKKIDFDLKQDLDSVEFGKSWSGSVKGTFIFDKVKTKAKLFIDDITYYEFEAEVDFNDMTFIPITKPVKKHKVINIRRCRDGNTV